MIRIIIDSTCEASQQALSNPRVHVVPLSVVFGKEALRDGVDISRGQFWQRLPAADPLPTTSQATPGDFIAPFRQFTDQGDEVLAILLSSKLSGTYDAAMAALRSLPGRPITVVDTLSVSVGSGVLLEHAIDLLEAGAGRESVAETLTAGRERVELVFALDTLEYLQRGGRIGRAQAFVGTLLKLKPLLGIKEGEVHPVGRVRARRNALERMRETLAHAVAERGAGVRLGIAQAGAEAEAGEVAELLARVFQTPHVFISTLGPVVGTHTGPGVIGAAVYPTGPGIPGGR